MSRAIVFLFTVLLATPLLAQQLRSPNGPFQIEVYHVSKADTSRPLRDIGPPLRPPARQHRPLFRVTVGSSNTTVADTVSQITAPTPAQLSSAGNFEGVAVNTWSPAVAPPDENLAVGPSHIVQTVNVQIGIFDKATGAGLSGFPKPVNSIWSGFGTACETHNDGDPIVRYDRTADDNPADQIPPGRWIVTQLTFDLNTQNYHQCLAVSTTPDPAGTYHRYDIDFRNRLQDYPKFAVWPDGWYMSANSFLFAAFLEGSNLCAWERDKLLRADTTAKVICAVTGSSAFAGLLPSEWDGATPPPSGSPNYFVGLYDTSRLAMFRMKPNYVTPSATSITGPTYIAVAPFNLPCGTGGDCVPQRESTQLLSTVGERLMYRLAYRNFGTHESMVVNHSVGANNTVGIRWYEIRQPGTTPVIHQQGTFVPDSDYRWMGSMAMDKTGNIAVGYSKSGPAMYPGIFITGREAGDSPGTLRAEQLIWAGSGSQQQGLNRWGDYSSIETDPVDDCTFWYTSQYLPGNGTFNWRTRIASFKFSSCGAAPPPPPSAPAAPGNLTATPVYTTTGKKQSLSRIDLTWADNSNNEDRFVLERWKLSGKRNAQTCGLETTFTLPANTTAYSDTSASTATCKYRIAAENAAGRSAWAETGVSP